MCIYVLSNVNIDDRNCIIVLYCIILVICFLEILSFETFIVFKSIHTDCCRNINLSTYIVMKTYRRS